MYCEEIDNDRECGKKDPCNNKDLKSKLKFYIKVLNITRICVFIYGFFI